MGATPLAFDLRSARRTQGVRGAAAVFALAVLVVGQVQWTQVTTSPMPSARQSFGMCYDSAREKVVLFGGYGGAYFNDTWEWDGLVWQLRNPLIRPPPRWDCSLVYDVSRGKCVLYGGEDLTPTRPTDIWEWDGAAWAQVLTAKSPPPRAGIALCFDARRNRTVLFGGGGGSMPWDDTWEYDGLTWRQILTNTRPYIRGFACLEYDLHSEHVYLFGGNSGIQISDLWEYDGADWRLLAMTGPQGREGAAMAYDAARRRLVVHGGRGSSSWLNDTWEWSGQSWVQRFASPAPPARASHRMVYDARREVLVMFGGRSSWPLGDQWTYRTNRPAVYSGFGAACAGTNGMPFLTSVGGTRPWAGEPLTVIATRVPANQPALLEFGSSKTSYLSLTLPFDLGAIGMPGCWLHVSAESALVAWSTSGSATFTFAVPSAPATVGAVFYNQVFVADPPTNALGIIATNAAEGRIGLR